MLAPALRREAADGSLEDLQQRLLHALAGDVARDGHVVRLRGDLVDLVDVDDAARGLGRVAAGVLPEVAHHVLHVLAHVAGLGERGGVADRERHLEELRERAGEERLAAARRPDEEDVGLLDLDVRELGAVRRLRGGGLEAAVVVVHGDGENLLRRLVSDHVLVEELLEFARRGDRAQRFGFRRCRVLRLFRIGLPRVHEDAAGGDDGRRPAPQRPALHPDRDVPQAGELA